MNDFLNTIVGLAGLSGAVILGLRAIEQRQFETSRQVYNLTFPHGLDKADVVSFIRSLSGLMRPKYRRIFGRYAVVFEVSADSTGIKHRLGIPADVADYVISQLRAAMPNVRVVPEEAGYKSAPITRALELGLSRPSMPIRNSQPASTVAAILASLQPVEKGETTVAQWVVIPSEPWQISDEQPRPTSNSHWSMIRWYWHKLTEIRKPNPKDASSTQEKLKEPVFWCVGRLGVVTKNDIRAKQLMRRLFGPTHIVRTPNTRLYRRMRPSRWIKGLLTRGVVPILSFPCLLNAAELAAIVAYPIDSLMLAGLHLGGSKQLPPAPDIPSKGRILGQASFPGSERPLAVSAIESRRHIHVMGPTGVGKSTLLLNLITADMNAGHGVTVIDPKGDLVADVLDRIPKGRERDVILLDPSDEQRSVGLNLLQGADSAPELVTDQVVGLFHRLYHAYWGPRTDDMLRATLLTLTHEPNMTLCEIPLMLTSPEFRQRIIGRIDDPIALGPFWAWYENMSDGERAQAIGPIMNKLRAFLLRRDVRHVIGQAKPGFNMHDVLAKNKILLVPLPKGLLGDDTASLLGSLVLLQLWQAVQARASLSADKRTSYFCYIDEFQDYLNLPGSIADILAQARGFGFGLTLANQHLGQLKPDLRQAVLANTRTKVVFQTAASDAATLAREFAPYLVGSDLQGLGPFEAVASIAVGGRVAPPVSMTTLPPVEAVGNAEAVRETSGLLYGLSRDEIEQEIRSRHEPLGIGGVIGRKEQL